MKFVKENRLVVICASVVLLFLIYTYAPIPGFSLSASKDALIAQLQTRYTVVNSLQNDAQTELVLGPVRAKGIPSESWVRAKKAMIDDINKQKDTLVEKVAAENAAGRIDARKNLILPNLETLVSVQRPDIYTYNFNNGEPPIFKQHYIQQFRYWTGLMATGAWKELDYADALPPSADVINALWEAKQKADAAARPAGAVGPGGPGGFGGFGGTGAGDSREKFDFIKARIQQRAAGDPNANNGLRMYVEPTAFQRRTSWADGNNPPDADEVFVGFIDSWLQADVVRAIVQTNNETLTPLPLSQRNVSRSPIKRLVRIVVGNNAAVRYLNPTTGGAGGAVVGGVGIQAGDPGAIFFTGTGVPTGGPLPGTQVTGPAVNDSNAGNVGGGGGNKPYKLPDKENTTDYTLSMTGRSTGKTYDTVYMSVVLDIDPAKLFVFTDKFYRLNPEYSIINTQMHTVDPLERAANGYLYGDGQVVEVELLVEAIFFRKWTEPLMPDKIKRDVLGGVQVAAP